MEKKPCGECGSLQRITKSGLIYKHGDCYGGGEHPLTEDVMKEFTPSETLVKSGYTAEDLHEMLQNITPKRKKLRERISGFFYNIRKRFEDIDDAWDVYDDE